jgi:hypothetical protein
MATRLATARQLYLLSGNIALTDAGPLRAVRPWHPSPPLARGAGEGNPVLGIAMGCLLGLPFWVVLAVLAWP